MDNHAKTRGTDDPIALADKDYCMLILPAARRGFIWSRANWKLLLALGPTDLNAGLKGK